jgi:hypothetical protein
LLRSSILDLRSSIFWRRRQESNLHRLSPGGLANRCHTVRRRLLEPRIEDRGSNVGASVAILYLLFSILDSLAEGERFELSQAEARRFSGPVHCQLCEPSAQQEQEELNLHQRFWRPPCCRLHHAPEDLMLREGIEPPLTTWVP